jgi:hypothetical protein
MWKERRLCRRSDNDRDEEEREDDYEEECDDDEEKASMTRNKRATINISSLSAGYWKHHSYAGLTER